jgi:hypothetical protein
MGEPDITGVQSLCLTAVEGEKLLGHVRYCFSDQEIFISALSAEDSAVADGLLRAALNSAVRSGIKTARFRNESLFSLLRNTGFRGLPMTSLPDSAQVSGEKSFESSDEIRIELKDVFGNCCEKSI